MLLLETLSVLHSMMKLRQLMQSIATGESALYANVMLLERVIDEQDYSHIF